MQVGHALRQPRLLRADNYPQLIKLRRKKEENHRESRHKITRHVSNGKTAVRIRVTSPFNDAQDESFIIAIK